MMNIWEKAKEAHLAASKAIESHISACAICKPDADVFCNDFPVLIDAALHAHEYPAGLDVMAAGECPIISGTTAEFGSLNCWLCNYGHQTECHYPQTCEEAHCSHWMAETLRRAEERPSDVLADKIYEHFCGPNPDKAAR
jgi:hypothetical protein